MADAVPGALADPAVVATEEVAFGDGLTGYLARPAAGDGPWPALLILHEAFGLNDHVRDLARRFAATGLVALAPDLYSREGTPDPQDFPAVMALMLAAPDARVVADLEAAAAALRARADSTGALGCIGFCSGGRQTLLFAANTTSLACAVDCWGGFALRASPDAETTPERPVAVIDQLGGLACPVLLVVGAEDTNPSPEDARALAGRAAELGKDVRPSVYEDAGHAFLADYRPSYRPGPAHRLWDEIQTFLGEHLRG